MKFLSLLGCFLNKNVSAGLQCKPEHSIVAGACTCIMIVSYHHEIEPA